MAGLVLSPGKATVLTVVVILLLAVSFGAGLLVAVAATLYPSRAATRLTPVDAIRHE